MSDFPRLSDARFVSAKTTLSAPTRAEAPRTFFPPAHRAEHQPIDECTARIEAELLWRGTNTIHYGCVSLRQQLIETFSTLKRWRQPRHVQLAGLLHCVYSSDEFDAPLFGLHERGDVQDLVGERAEQIIYQFCSVRSQELVASLGASKDNVHHEFRVANRLGEGVLELSAPEIGNLLVLHMASSAQHVSDTSSVPEPRLAALARLGRFASGRAEVTPPVFDFCSVHFTEEDERALISDYLALLSASAGDSKSEERVRLLSVKNFPWVGEPLIWLGLRALAEGDAQSAASLGDRGMQQLLVWNMAWDRRLSATHWLALANLLCRAGTLQEAERNFLARQVDTVLRNSQSRPEVVYAQLDALHVLRERTLTRTEHIVLAGSDAGTGNADVLPPRFSRYIASFRDQRGPMFRLPEITAHPWWEASHFAIVKDLETMASEIATEFFALERDRFQPENEPQIGRKGGWDVFLLYERGRKNVDNCRRCPVTAQIVESHRTMLTPVSGLIYFSRMAPNTTIAPHRGPTNMRLRCHLGIDIPEQCGIRVGGVAGKWQQGKCIVFDDSQVHDAWNFGTRDRSVLVIDLWHPDLSDEEIELLVGLHGHVGRFADSVNRYWATDEEISAHDDSSNAIIPAHSAR